MSLNKVMLIGRVGQDPVIRQTTGGSATANLSVATTEYYRNLDGERQEETTWHNVTAFGKTAEFIEKYVGKGRSIFVEGRIRNRKYTTRDGEERSVTEVVADNVQPLDKPKEDEGGSSSRPMRNGNARPASRPVEAYDNNNGADDLPF